MKTADYTKNAELLERVRNGDTQAETEFLNANMGLIRSIALHFKDRAAESHGCDLEDLMQLGSIGLIKAMKSYDPSFGTVFSTYAVPLIIGEIKRFLRDDGHVKVSRTTKRLSAEIMHSREAFIRKEGREPSVDELCGLCGISREELCSALLALKPPHSFSDTVTDDGVQLGELLPSETDELEGLCDKLSLREAISSLPPLWREIIALRYFREYSQQQTAEVLGLTQVKISREEKKIFAKLRAML